MGGSMRMAPLRLVPKDAPGAGEGCALDQAFRAFGLRVTTAALRILGRRDEADDLAQDVFLKARRWLPRLRDPNALQSWLLKVTVRMAWRRLRKRRLYLALGLDEGYDYREVAGKGQLSPEDAAFMAEVYRLLDRLPTGQRLAWTLRHVDGERLEDVAELCGCSLATAKRWIASAHDLIHREIGDV
jgi:RNA polymerase sigma-70 factor, ECF subfamily